MFFTRSSILPASLLPGFFDRVEENDMSKRRKSITIHLPYLLLVPKARQRIETGSMFECKRAVLERHERRWTQSTLDFCFQRIILVCFSAFKIHGTPKFSTGGGPQEKSAAKVSTPHSNDFLGEQGDLLMSVMCLT